MAGNSQNQKKHLRALLKQKIDEMSDEAIQTNGHIPASRLDEIAGIEKLINALDKSASRSLRWPMISLSMVTLFIVSFLLFAHVSSTEIELDISLSEVSFRSSQPQVVSGIARLSSIGITGLDGIEFPQTEKSERRIFNSDDGTTNAVKLFIESNHQQESSLTLSPIPLNKGSYVWLQPNAETPSEYRLSFRSPGLNLQADVFGSIAACLPGSPAEQFSFASPESIQMHTGKNDVELTMEPLNITKAPFLKQLFIDSLSMFHTDEYLNEEHTLIKQLSTIIGGTLYYESLGEMEYKLRSGQEISFGKLTGFIRTMEIRDGHVAFAFHGTVSGMTTGDDKNRVSLMPRYLEWLKAQHSLSLFWGTAIYFFGLIISIMHWWKTTK